MKRLLISAAIAAGFLTASGYVYPNFIEAGKYAIADKDYRLAEYFHEVALEDIPEDSIVDVIVTNYKLRDIRLELRDYPQALKNGQRGIDLIRSLGMDAGSILTHDYIMLANVHARMNDSIGAACMLDTAFRYALNAKTDLTDKMDQAMAGGVVYARIKDWKTAEACYGLAVDISRQAGEPDDKIRALNLYGNSLFSNGRRSDALSIYKEQREVCRRSYGEDSRQYKWADYCIANMHAFLGDTIRGMEIYSGVMGWYRDRMNHNLRTLPSTERSAYLENMIDIIQNAIPFAAKAKMNADGFTRLAYEGLLLTKGLLLVTEKSTESIIRKHGSDINRANLDVLKEEKLNLSRLRADSQSEPKAILNCYARIKGLDHVLAASAARLGDNMDFAAITYEDVMESLGDDEVLLDFADFRPKSEPHRYVCFEIRKGMRYPRLHNICNGNELDSLLALENQVWSNLYDGEAGDDMARIVGKPLKDIIGDSKTVYYVPSGIFHKLAIEAIPDKDGIFEDSHTFRRLSSAREIVGRSGVVNSGSARLYGGLDYGKPVSDVDDGLRTPPSSLEEVKHIAALLEGASPLEVMTGSLGTKESFMDMSGVSPRIIHLSTHGFHYRPEDKDRPASLQGYDDAMALSGLVMSGGNTGWTGRKTMEGILTAQEMAACDLSTTDLACLATCNSGDGEITPEGIYGLQRALKKAGVKTIILSLWEASDIATKEFMTNFYTALTTGRNDVHEAFRLARRAVREKYPSPYYWGGFIMVD